VYLKFQVKYSKLVKTWFGIFLLFNLGLMGVKNGYDPRVH